MEQNKTNDIKSAEVKETELDQISGGVNDINPNEFYEDGNKIDLLNTDFLSEKIEIVTQQ